MPARYWPLLTSLILPVAILLNVQALAVRGWLYKFQIGDKPCDPNYEFVRRGPHGAWAPKERVYLADLSEFRGVERPQWATFNDSSHLNVEMDISGLHEQQWSPGLAYPYPTLPPCGEDEDDPNAVIFYHPPYLKLLMGIAITGGLVATIGLMGRCFLFWDRISTELLIAGASVQAVCHLSVLALFLSEILPLPQGLHLTQGIVYCSASCVLAMAVAGLRGYDEMTRDKSVPEEFHFGLSDSQTRLILAVNGFVLYLIVTSTLYTLGEGHMFDDAIYWSVATSCTIGFGDFTVKTEIGRAIFPFFAGVAIFFTTMVVLSIREVVLEGLAIQFAGVLSRLFAIAERIDMAGEQAKRPAPIELESDSDPGTPPRRALGRRMTAVSIVTAPRSIEGGRRREFSISGPAMGRSWQYAPGVSSTLRRNSAVPGMWLGGTPATSDPETGERGRAVVFDEPASDREESDAPTPRSTSLARSGSRAPSIATSTDGRLNVASVVYQSPKRGNENIEDNDELVSESHDASDEDESEESETEEKPKTVASPFAAPTLTLDRFGSPPESQRPSPIMGPVRRKGPGVQFSAGQPEQAPADSAVTMPDSEPVLSSNEGLRRPGRSVSIAVPSSTFPRRPFPRRPSLSRRMSLDPSLFEKGAERTDVIREIRIKRGKYLPQVSITTDFKIKKGDVVDVTKTQLNRLILVGLLMLFAHLLCFGAWFAWMEGWTSTSGWYFCFVALTTIGYGDLTPTSLHAKTIFIAYVFLGIPNLTFLGSVIGERLSSGWKVHVDKTRETQDEPGDSDDGFGDKQKMVSGVVPVGIESGESP